METFVTCIASHWNSFRTQSCRTCSTFSTITLLFYINNLAASLTGDAIIALFADDISILTTDCKRDEAEAAV